MTRRNELLDFIKQIGYQGLIFFTFNVTDLYQPELHNLMSNSENIGDEIELAKQ